MTSAHQVVIDLASVSFTAHEAVLARAGAISVSSFRYPSGVAALRIVNRVGEIVVLPFHGQQIWDATFYGRRLTMRSIFDEPTASRDYLHNYGGFLLHCGATAMGNPGAGDTHPLHGELPNAPFDQAQLATGLGDAPFVELSGTYHHKVAFGANYAFTPALRLHEDTGRLDLGITVRNLRSKPMELMYLAHINFRPVDGASIVDAVPDTTGAMRVRRRLPEFFTPDAAYRELLKSVAAEPGLHRPIVAGRRIDPELVIALDCVAGADGWSHALQRLPDGTADFVSHRPTELTHAVRWMTRNGDEDALGLVLPATAEADGREAERAKGNVRSLAPGAEFHCTLAFGALTASEVPALLDSIEAARTA